MGYIELLVCAATVAMAGSSASANTVAHWTFEEGPVNTVAIGPIIDLTGNHNATPFNGPTYRSAPSPNGSLGLQFEGVSERVFVADHPDFVLSSTFTLEALAIRAAGPARFSYFIIRADDRPGLDPYALRVIEDGRAVFTTHDGTSVTHVYSSAPLPECKMTAVTGVFDNDAGIQKLYFNGVEVGSGSPSGVPFSDLSAARNPGLGIGNTQGDQYQEAFRGIIAEARISNVALNPEQFLQIPEPPNHVDPSHCVPEPASIVVWAVLVPCALGFVAFGHRRRPRSERQCTSGNNR